MAENTPGVLVVAEDDLIMIVEVMGGSQDLDEVLSQGNETTNTAIFNGSGSNANLKTEIGAYGGVYMTDSTINLSSRADSAGIIASDPDNNSEVSLNAGGITFNFGLLKHNPASTSFTDILLPITNGGSVTLATLTDVSLQGVLDNGTDAQYGSYNYAYILKESGADRNTQLGIGDGTKNSRLRLIKDYASIDGENNTTGSKGNMSINDGSIRITQENNIGRTNLIFTSPTNSGTTNINIPTKPAGNYTLATLTDVSLQGVLENGTEAEFGDTNFINILGENFDDTDRLFEVQAGNDNSYSNFRIGSTEINLDYFEPGGNHNVLYMDGTSFTLSHGLGNKVTNVEFTDPIASGGAVCTLKFPAKAGGIYTLATLDDLPSTSGFLHIAGDESFSGIKSSINTGTTQINGLSLTNNGTTNTSYVLKIANTANGVGQYIDNQGLGFGLSINNTGAGTGIRMVTSSSGRSIYNLVSNSFGIGLETEITAGGIGFNALNQSSGLGLQVINASSGTGIIVQASGTGNAIVSNVTNTGTGFNFVGQNITVNTFTVDKLGNVTGNTFVKTGGSGTQYLMANGTVSTLKTVNGGSLVGTGDLAVSVAWNAITGNQKDVNLIGFIDGLGKDAVVTGTAAGSTSQNYYGIAFGNDIWVAIHPYSGVGNPPIMTSPDGITWTMRTGPTVNTDWQSIVFGGGVFVGISATGAYTRSSDGITWTNGSLPVASNWGDITFGNGLFVAIKGVAASQCVATSPDGVTWTMRTTPQPGNQWGAGGITYGNGLFVAVSASGTNRVMTSPDGINWTIQGVTTGIWRSITYGGGLFVAVGESGAIMTSPDGIAWTTRTSPVVNGISGVAYGGGLFVAVCQGGANQILISNDGVTWTSKASTNTSNQWIAVAYGNGFFVSVTGFVSTNIVQIITPTAERRFENIVNYYTVNGTPVTIPQDRALNFKTVAGQSVIGSNGDIVMAVASSTTTVLSDSTLNSTYPSAFIGFRVHCASITTGGLVYEKTDIGWINYAINATVAQTQVNVTGNITLDATYNNCILKVKANCTITIPSTLPTDFNCVARTFPTYTATFVGGSGTTMDAPQGLVLAPTKMATLFKDGSTTTYVLEGELTT